MRTLPWFLLTLAILAAVSPLAIAADATPSITFPAQDWTSIGLQAWALIAPVVAAVFGWAGLALRRWLVAQTKSETLGRLVDLAAVVVAELEQTTVAAIREAAADGKIDEAEKVRIKGTALATFKSRLGAKGLAEVKAVFGIGPTVIDGFLVTLIESAVPAVKAVFPSRLTVPTLVYGPPAE